MRLLVTGGTGFVGSHLVPMAWDAGHDVTVLRRSESSCLPGLPKSPRWLTKKLDSVTQLDLGISQPYYDAIIHLAAHSANHPYDTLEQCFYWNVIAPLRLFEAAAAVGIKRFVVAGSYFEYGRTFRRHHIVPPWAALEPTGSYPISKAAASMAFVEFARVCQIKLSIHRICQVFGDGELDTRFWPSLRAAAVEGRDFQMSRGEQIRDFIPVKMVGAALLGALSLDLKAGQPIVENVGTGSPQSLKDFALKWWTEWKATGKLQLGALPDRPGELERCVPLIGESYVYD